MIIYDIREKGKKSLETAFNKLFMPILIIGIGFAAFGMVKIIHIEEGKVPVSIEYPAGYLASTTSSLLPLNFPDSNNSVSQNNALNSPAQTKTEPQQKAQNTVQLKPLPRPSAIPVVQGMYVAARGGKAYYFPWCATVKRIADKNKIWFSSKEEAEKAGYVPGNCKDMK